MDNPCHPRNPLSNVLYCQNPLTAIRARGSDCMYNHSMPRQLAVKQIGIIARQAIDQATDAKVIGITSRGVFLLLEDGWVVFLSIEDYTGPLTLNLASRLEGLLVNDLAQIGNGVLTFERGNLSIDTHPAVVWQPAHRPENFLSSQERHELLYQAAYAFSKSQAAIRARYSDLLPVLLNVPDGENGPCPGLPEAFKSLWDEWRLAFQNKSYTQSFQQALVASLGLGNGLTPSGDDLLAGLLLALNRWGDVLAPGFPIHLLNKAVLAAAPGATTALSASILRCSSQGLADERLVKALDGLMTGQVEIATIVEGLRTYGASSGLDTLAGFFIACG